MTVGGSGVVEGEVLVSGARRHYSVCRLAQFSIIVIRRHRNLPSSQFPVIATTVIPAKAGTQRLWLARKALGSGVRRNDGWRE